MRGAESFPHEALETASFGSFSEALRNGKPKPRMRRCAEKKMGDNILACKRLAFPDDTLELARF